MSLSLCLQIPVSVSAAISFIIIYNVYYLYWYENDNMDIRFEAYFERHEKIKHLIQYDI